MRHPPGARALRRHQGPDGLTADRPGADRPGVALEHPGAFAGRDVRVVVLGERDRLVVEIVDDGCGFDVATTLLDAGRRGRLGLVGVSERARLLGGSCEIHSRPGGPTRVAVELPRWRPRGTAQRNRRTQRKASRALDFRRVTMGPSSERVEVCFDSSRRCCCSLPSQRAFPRSSSRAAPARRPSARWHRSRPWLPERRPHPGPAALPTARRSTRCPHSPGAG